jgi:hypothetical protein
MLNKLQVAGCKLQLGLKVCSVLLLCFAGKESHGMGFPQRRKGAKAQRASKDAKLHFFAPSLLCVKEKKGSRKVAKGAKAQRIFIR